MSAVSPRVIREGKRFFKFTVVGLVGAVVDFGTFNVLSAILGIWSVVASMLSFSAAVTSNFVWNRLWTYPDSRTKPIRHQAGQFALVNLIGLAIRTPIFALAEPQLIRVSAGFLATIRPSASLDAAIIGRNAALALAVTVVLFWNFSINRLWTYSDVS